MKIRVMDVVRGITAHSGRKVSTERGLIYDMNRNEHVSGIVIKVGTSEIALTDEQAERLSDYIRAEFLRDEYEESLAKAIQRHPSSKGFLSDTD